MQKTNVCLELPVCIINLITNIQIFISNKLGICCYILLPLVFQMATPLQKSCCGLLLADSGSNSCAVYMSAPYMSHLLY